MCPASIDPGTASEQRVKSTKGMADGEADLDLTDFQNDEFVYVY